ncbi:MAG: PaaI family thioesterase [Halioglobus sp.]|nr:PaaI family thioesterase [Halioglobus sp.]
MSDDTVAGVPAGFERLRDGLGFADALQPVYRRMDAQGTSFGLVVLAQHGNSMGICHGGVLMSLADMAAASGVNLARGEIAGCVTINLTLDFIAAARQGDWLQADAEQVHMKRRFGFCNGALYCAGRTVARFNGTFYVPDHDGMWSDERTREDILRRN